MSDSKTIVVRPNVIDDVLINPGIGFMTFQRFNGDKLNPGKGWTEGFPIEYQEFDGNLEVEGHPMTSMAYFRVYWRYLEPEKGKYNWDMIDKALKTAHERKQTLMFRLAPHGTETKDRDVPDWYREMVGEEKEYADERWRVDPEDPRYVEHFGGIIRKLGERYDGHPDLESVDMSIVGPWGEGAGSHLLSQHTREALIDAYVESFHQTPLLMLISDAKTHAYANSKANVGWRADCLGDMGVWHHMTDIYPQRMIEGGMQEAWKKAPVSFEVCWVVQHWYDMGWDIDYIIDQSLKWHISSFNGKSSAIPKEWEPNIERWLKKMGYRFALRRFEYPESIMPGGKLEFTSWWENLGVAPCYKAFPLAIRLKNEQKTYMVLTDADIRDWLPGDILYNNRIYIPWDMPVGSYQLELAIVDKVTFEPKVQLASEGRQEDGWYRLGNIEVR